MRSSFIQLAIMSLFVMWLYEWGLVNRNMPYRDVLEIAPTVRGPWHDVPGPYRVVNGQYRVPITDPAAFAFYRVRRAYGSPNVLP